VILSLFDYSAIMVEPWLRGGHDAYVVDLQHPPGVHQKTHVGGSTIYREGADLLTWVPPRWLANEVDFVAAFPPCTSLAVSGARWFTDLERGKGIPGLIESFKLIERSVFWLEWFNASPGFFENPVSTIGSYYRKPDFTFHPKDYTGWCADDNYSKKTCLWAFNGFTLPDFSIDETVGEHDTRIHRAGPSPERANFRAKTPLGFAKAVFDWYDDV